MVNVKSTYRKRNSKIRNPKFLRWQFALTIQSLHRLRNSWGFCYSVYQSLYKFYIGLINTLYIHRESNSKNKELLLSITHTKNEALSDDLTTLTLQSENFSGSCGDEQLRYQTNSYILLAQGAKF